MNFESRCLLLTNVSPKYWIEALFMHEYTVDEIHPEDNVTLILSA